MPSNPELSATTKRAEIVGAEVVSTGVVRVAVPTPLRKLFDYLPPEGLRADQVAIGSRVRVSFGRRHLVGIAVGHAADTDAGVSLKPIREVLDKRPALPPDLLELITWAAGYYHHPLGEALATALPVLLRRGAAEDARGEAIYALSASGWEAARTPPKRAPRQVALLTLLAGHPEGMARTALDAEDGDWNPTLRTLRDKGWLTLSHRSCLPPPVESVIQGPVPNIEQQAAIDAITSASGFTGFLLDGVTGSGKTEVYLRAIEFALAQRRQALVLVPEIGLTPQLVARFRARLAVPIAVLHSGLNDSERLCSWQQAASGEARVVIGTRSAAFTPLPEPGLFILDEEHDASFKQQDGFRYSARDVLLMRGRRSDVPVVLGSATPSLESLHNVERGRLQKLPLRARAGDASPPRVALLDMRAQPLNGGLSPRMWQSLERHLAEDGQVLLFLNRRGYAPVMSCHDCGWLPACSRCDANLVVHQREGRLRCHHCGHEQPIPRACPSCRSERLRPLGQGTERLEQELRKRFPEQTVLRIDRDSTRRKGALHDALDEAQSGRARILVGTQMLAKGHHFPNVTLVGIVDADGGLFGADFRAAERMAQQVVQVAGRAGRAERRGEVLIQTHSPDHPLLNTLIHADYATLAQSLMDERRAAELPPFSALALLRAEAHDLQIAQHFLRSARHEAERIGIAGVLILGPAPAAMARRAGKHRVQLLLQAPERAPLHRLIPGLLKRLDFLPSMRKVRWTLDVDPIEVV
ncbi:MAG: primosomal protein N' [Gammaproteobacteria bacterium]|nr:primosomal protein N' [Gammaproteobacteria bacterium]MCP5136427.1 primosomal protein N' [Gammaproteobacteria bacterium]